MYLEEIKNQLFQLDWLADLQELPDLIHKITDREGASWDYVFLACEAVGTDYREALPCAAANLCLLQSIHLVDDMLDNDPYGIHHRFGTGSTSNFAIALQALGLLVASKTRIGNQGIKLIQDNLSEMMLRTSIGQQNEFNHTSLVSEQKYWQHIRQKSPPLFSSGLYTGALAGGATKETADSIAALGLTLGQMIQIGDDLNDVFEDTVNPDWLKPNTNLALIYASLADYEEKGRLIYLIESISKSGHLQEAQQLLIKCGAYSYCLYHLFDLHKRSTQLINSLDIPFPEKLYSLVELLIRPAFEIITMAKEYSVYDIQKFSFKEFDPQILD